MSTTHRIVVILAVAFLPALASLDSLTPSGAAPLVQLEKGAIRGISAKSHGGRPFSAFLGVPYARPPVGKYRFKEPKALKPWQGVWEAHSPPPKCVQFERYPVSSVQGEEDCLYLNVYTPKLPTAGAPLLDVLVWIHGGGFMYGGSAEWGPEYFMDRDIVLVTVNYRLGPLGFLSTQDEVVPGNVGLKDQSMALRWLQGNVAAFGGNPNSVTLLGLSAGGASVHYHYLSPLSQGLFHRGWSMSGSSMCPWTQQEAALAKAHRLAELVGCPSALSAPSANVTTRDLVDCLRHRPARALAGVVPKMQDELQLPFSPFAPVVEPLGSPGAFVDTAPIVIIREGRSHDLPWITGITTEEGLYNAAEFLGRAQAHKLEEVSTRWLDKAPLLLDYDLTVESTQRDAVSKAVKEQYFGSRPISDVTSKDFIAMVGDRIFNAGVELAAREMSRAHRQPVYLYEFGYRGANSISSAMTADGDLTDWGVSHADDAGYLFKWSWMPTGNTTTELTVREQLLTLLTTFAKTGVPSATPGSPGWAPLDTSASELHILRIDRQAKLSFTTVPELGRTSFWTSQPLAENVPTAGASQDHDEL